MPRIIVMADRPTDTVILSERIGVADLDSEQFRAQLLERLSWAVGDAYVAEQATARSELSAPRCGPVEPSAFTLQSGRWCLAVASS